MRRYLKILLLWFLAFAAFCTVLNYVVNPYDYWDVPRIDGFNAVKPEFGRQQSIAKPRQWERWRPEIAILGNSRVQVGFDPKADVWKGQRVYNAGFPGRDLVAQLRAVRRIPDVGRLRTLYVGIDFLDFRISKKDWEDNPVRPEPQGPLSSARQYAELLWSNSALKDSLATLFAQFQDGTSTVTLAGFNPADDFRLYVDKVGPQRMFALKEKEYLKDLEVKPKRTLWPTPGQNPNWQAVRELIQWAEASDIELVFFTHPYHASLLDAFDRFGLWPAFEAWKSNLTHIAAQHDTQLWDFAVFSEETMEKVKESGDMSFYWEAGHYKAALGEAMVSQMQGGDGFGTVLSPGNVQTHLLQQREFLKAYRGAQFEATRRDEVLDNQSALRKSTSELATK